MAREDRPARNTTADPAVPGPRQHTTEPAGAPSRAQPSHVKSAEHVLEGTRLSGTWVAVGCFAVVLLFLLFFILLNDSQVHINFFGAHVQMHLGVALVLSAVCGALLVALAGMARIMQLRGRARKHQRMVGKAASR
jgi:uncharacterized integral membrane protein